MLPNKGLTATIIFEGQSLNFDEGYGGNLSVLKKFHRGNGGVYSYSSRQSLRYSIFLQGVKEFGWSASEVEAVGSHDKRVTQLVSSIKDSEESDLFGYFHTNIEIGKQDNAASVSRTSPVRLLPAIALEPFSSDMEMLTNKYQADKLQLQSSIANFENQRSLFRYSICIDLHRVGSEEDEIGTRFSPNKEEYKKSEAVQKFVQDLRKQSIPYERRSKRVTQLLEIIGRLYRDIRGRREDLKPLFIIGGVYDTFNPFFENIVNVEWDGRDKKPKINIDSIGQVINADYMTIDMQGNEKTKSVKNDTFIGIREGFFSSGSSAFKTLYEQKPEDNVGSPEDVISKLKKKVTQYYTSEIART